MKKTLLMLAVAGVFSPMLAHAEAGDWVLRGRIVHVAPNESSDLGSTVNGAIPGAMSSGAKLNVDSNTIPEVDISYYFTKNIAAELILALGTRHDVTIQGDSLATVGNQALGSVNLLPPVLTLQWHFNPDAKIDPYVGAGVNFTRFMDRSLRLSSGALAGTDIRLDSTSFGLAAQAGVDINLENGWLLNADVKYVQISTDVKLNYPANSWTKIDSLDIDPWVFGVGFGKKF